MRTHRRTYRQLCLAVVGALVLLGTNACKTSMPLAPDETGTLLALNETFDQVVRGVRLIMAYDAPNNAFAGTAENVTAGVVIGVRVEVHLSNGVELGPSTPTDLTPGQVININLPVTTSLPFTRWDVDTENGAPGTGS